MLETTNLNSGCFPFTCIVAAAAPVSLLALPDLHAGPHTMPQEKDTLQQPEDIMLICNCLLESSRAAVVDDHLVVAACNCQHACPSAFPCSLALKCITLT